MPTLGFYMLLFYDLYYSEGFQCPVTLNVVQAQRFSIVIGVNFVGEVMSLINSVENLGRNGEAFLNTSPSSQFCTRFENVFGAPKLCAFSQSQHMPLTQVHSQAPACPKPSVWSKACQAQIWGEMQSKARRKLKLMPSLSLDLRVLLSCNMDQP